MIRVRRSIAARRRQAGLSLIEMMVALVMALIVAAGIITVFESTSSSNRVQAQLATLQEEGRFAIHSMRQDLGNANGAYCSNTGGNARQTAAGVALDSLNAPMVVSNDMAAINPAFADNTTPLDTISQPFFLPSFLYMRGYACTASACTPLDPNTAAPGIPVMGTAVGNRVVGTSVLTLRYLKPDSGWAIVPASAASAAGAGSTLETIGTGSASHVTAIDLLPLPGETSYTGFGVGDLAMLADCSASYVFSVSGQGSNTLTLNSNYTAPSIRDNSGGSAPRVFDFNKDFQTVTYFLRVVDAGNGHKTGELVRRVNDTDQALVRGVERLDFSYGIIDADGNTRFLTAAQVDDKDGNSISCPPGVQTAPDVGYTATTGGGTPDQGCLWRAIQTIQVNILMDGQTPLYTLTSAEMKYIYSPDGDTMNAPSAHAIKPSTQGFPDQLLRREFTTLVALRNFNP